MNFEEYEIPIAESHFLRITTSFLLFLIFLCFIWNKKSDKFAKADCLSQDCVHCNKNTEVVSNAKALFKDLFPETNRTNSLKRMASALLNPSSMEYVLYIDGLNRKKLWHSYNLPNSYVDDIKLLEDNVHLFLNDYNTLIQSCNVGLDEKWMRLYMINQGYLNTQLISMCKKSFSILDHCQHIMRTCVFGYAYFSMLRPGTIVAKHVGSTNVRLRVHIPLLIPNLNNPDDICEMDVDGEKVNWEFGKAVIFDDSFLHSVKYQTKCKQNSNRIVLLVDFWHPDVTVDERLCIQEVFYQQ